MVKITQLERREIMKLLRAIERPDLIKLCGREFIASVDDAERTIAACVEKIVEANPERLYPKLVRSTK